MGCTSGSTFELFVVSCVSARERRSLVPANLFEDSLGASEFRRSRVLHRDELVLRENQPRVVVATVGAGDPVELGEFAVEHHLDRAVERRLARAVDDSASRFPTRRLLPVPEQVGTQRGSEVTEDDDRVVRVLSLALTLVDEENLDVRLLARLAPGARHPDAELATEDAGVLLGELG